MKSRSRPRRQREPDAGAPSSTVVPLSSPAEDARRLRRHVAGTSEELRAFLDQLRGRSAREMLGAVAASNLFRSTVQAATGAAVLVAVFTILPFAWSKLAPSASRTSPEESVESAPDAAPGAASGAVAPPSTPSTFPAGSGTPELPDTTEALEALGVGQEKSAPPDVNPLENANDDLLKELD